MKVIVAGSRSFSADENRNRDIVYNAVQEAPFKITELVNGGAKGVDYIARTLAQVGHIDADVNCFEADWDEHGRAAGPIRNQEMAEYADALIAVWDGESPGTLDMIKKALSDGLDVYVKQVDQEGFGAETGAEGERTE